MSENVYGFEMGCGLEYIGAMYVRVNDNENLVFGTVSQDELNSGVTYSKVRESRIAGSAVSVVDAFLVAATAMSRDGDVEAVRRNVANGVMVVVHNLRKAGIIED